MADLTLTGGRLRRATHARAIARHLGVRAVPSHIWNRAFASGGRIVRNAGEMSSEVWDPTPSEEVRLSPIGRVRACDAGLLADMQASAPATQATDRDAFVARFVDVFCTGYGIVFDRSAALVDHWAAERALAHAARWITGRQALVLPTVLGTPTRLDHGRRHGSLFVAPGHDPDNYFHFLTHVVPSVLRLLPHMAGAPGTLWVRCATAFQKEILNLLVPDPDDRMVSVGGGLARSALDATEAIMLDVRHARTLWLASWQDPRHPPYSSLRATRRRLCDVFAIPANGACDRVVVVRRTGGRAPRARTCANHEALVSALRSRLGNRVDDFDPSGRTVREQATCFSRARVVISAHGAALANLLFCPLGTDAIELFAPGHMHDHYHHLASALSLGYHAQVMDPSGGACLVETEPLVDYVERLCRETKASLG